MKRRDFLASLADLAAEFQRKIEAECSSFPVNPAASAERKRRAQDDFGFFCATYFPHYLKHAPYDTTLADLRETARVVWARLSTIELFGKIGHPARCIILAGAKYREHVETELRSRGVLEVESPLAGLAIGLQKQRLAAMTAAAIGAAA